MAPNLDSPIKWSSWFRLTVDDWWGRKAANSRRVGARSKVQNKVKAPDFGLDNTYSNSGLRIGSVYLAPINTQEDCILCLANKNPTLNVIHV